MKKKLSILFGTLLLACSLPLSGTTASEQRFSDVPDTKHFAEAVNDFAARAIIGGYPDGTFKPSNSITRGQAAAIIAKLLKLDTTNVKNPGFKDVRMANGYYKAIAALAQANIIGGYPDGSYGPNDPITREQMASILVKAFDLPRYDYQQMDNPFIDSKNPSHEKNILILYKLGITTGTTPNTYSPKNPITRGQAAKMMKATEEVNVPMVTVKAEDFGWERIAWVGSSEMNSGVFQAIHLRGKDTPNGYTGDRVQLIPMKEGKGAISFRSNSREGTERYKKYYVHIKEVDGELKLTLEETTDYFPAEAELSFDANDIQHISFTTMDGKKLSDDVKFTSCENGYGTCIQMDGPGQYIATVHLKNGDEERHGIEVKPTGTFYYKVETLKEQYVSTYDRGNFDIGKHTIRAENYEQLVTITRDPGTNFFTARLTGDKEGFIRIEFERGERSELYQETGIYISIRKLGSIMNIEIHRDGYTTDM
ncbi:Parasporal protein [Sporosarcina sp. P12(2017)]|uniref:S-layer homology domain-containing protein n=1 Tax=unclassified Sporosarcina TaxID=2647733 RepID=UPI000C172910|nr:MULTISPECIES: S-layer homology domain-containing protein [unclassified Sporosarcina]PIC56671.1 Parasporal protein [Sporosarcina sp. P10]PIC59888.1 Parasporal protein [Sporosarcina sp. P12(2017)]